MEWCNNNTKNGLQIIQISENVVDTPTTYTMAQYMCNSNADRRVIIVFGYHGIIYMNVYNDTNLWSGWKQINSYSDVSWTNLYNKYCKYKSSGGVVTVKGESNGEYALTKGSYKAISTLPIGYRPTEPIYFTGTSLGGAANVFGFVSTSGIINLYSDSDDTTYWAYNCTFVI